MDGKIQVKESIWGRDMGDKDYTKEWDNPGQSDGTTSDFGTIS